MRPALASPRWRPRHHHVFVHVSCSALTMAVLVNARSSSRIFHAVARQVSAILLCSFNRPLNAHTGTDRNPADTGSRVQNATREGSRISPSTTLSLYDVCRHIVCEALAGNCETALSSFFATVVTSSKLFETTSTGSLTGDRAQGEDNLSR